MQCRNVEGAAHCDASLLLGRGSQAREPDDVADRIDVFDFGLVVAVGLQAAARLRSLVAPLRPILDRALSVTICLPLARHVRTRLMLFSSNTSIDETFSPSRSVTRRSRKR